MEEGRGGGGAKRDEGGAMTEAKGEKEIWLGSVASGSIVGVARLCSLAAFLALMSARTFSFEGLPGAGADSDDSPRWEAIPSGAKVVVKAEME
jgi:hypothetical protein